MQTQSMINKGNISLGLYNLSNPMINGEYTKDMIDYISNLIQSKISPIQDLIFEETIKILEPIFNNQNKEISELKNELNDLYISYIQQICNLNLGNEYSEQIKLLNIEIQNLNNINNNFNEQSNKLSLLKNQLKQGINYDEILNELNNIIEIIDKKTKENEMEIDYDINYKDIFNKYKQIENKLNKINENSENIKNEQMEKIYLKSCKILEEAQKKFSANEPDKNIINENNFLNNIINFKIKEPF